MAKSYIAQDHTSRRRTPAARRLRAASATGGFAVGRHGAGNGNSPAGCPGGAQRSMDRCQPAHSSAAPKYTASRISSTSMTQLHDSHYCDGEHPHKPCPVPRRPARTGCGPAVETGGKPSKTGQCRRFRGVTLFTLAVPFSRLRMETKKDSKNNWLSIFFADCRDLATVRVCRK